MFNIAVKDGKHFITDGSGRVVGRPGSKNDARNQLGSLLASSDEEKSIFFGGAIKALDDTGRVGGFAILHTTKKDPDLTLDYFKAVTDYFIEPGEEATAHLMYHHGLDPTIKARRLGKVSVQIKDAGVWVEGQMALRDKFEKAIFKMVQDGKLGWSTGSAAHLVERKCIDHEFDPENVKACKGQVHEILSWPVIEASMTPFPTEARTLVEATSMKAYVENLLAEDGDALKGMQVEDDPKDKEQPQRATKSLHEKLDKHLARLVEDGADRNAVVKAMADEAMVTVEQMESVLEGKARPNGVVLKGISDALGINFDVLKALNAPKAGEMRGIKGMFEDELVSKQERTYELWNALSCVVSKVMNAAVAAKMLQTEYDWQSQAKEALEEFSAHMEKAILTQGQEYLDGNTEYGFYLKALGDPREQDFISAKSILAANLAMAVSAFDSVIGRMQARADNRLKDDRKMWVKSYQEFKGFFNDVSARISRGYVELDRHKPVTGATPERKALEANLLREQHRANQVLLDTTV